MNNKPVAWMVERTTGIKGYGDTPYVTLLEATIHVLKAQIEFLKKESQQ